MMKMEIYIEKHRERLDEKIIKETIQVTKIERGILPAMNTIIKSEGRMMLYALETFLEKFKGNNMIIAGLERQLERELKEILEPELSKSIFELAKIRLRECWNTEMWISIKWGE